jgi:triacylglycerol lipase
MADFEPKTVSFSATNALWLGKAANLAYENEATVQAGLAQRGMTGTFVDAVDPPKGDTQAFVAADAAKLVVSFRGTKDVLDFLTDAEFLQKPFAPAGAVAGKVHDGFQKALDVGWPAVRAAIAKLRGANQPVWVTGHSLGAALATLAVARLRNERMDVAGLYTFGSPTVGDPTFAASFDKATKGRVFRYVNDLDIVTRCPPEGVPLLPPYKHVGERKFFGADGALTDHPDPLRWASVVAAAASIAVKGKSMAREALKADLALHLKEPLDDHAMAGYAANLEKALNAPQTTSSSGGGLLDLWSDLKRFRSLWGK